MYAYAAKWLRVSQEHKSLVSLSLLDKWTILCSSRRAQNKFQHDVVRALGLFTIIAYENILEITVFEFQRAGNPILV